MFRKICFIFALVFWGPPETNRVVHKVLVEYCERRGGGPTLFWKQIFRNKSHFVSRITPDFSKQIFVHFSPKKPSFDPQTHAYDARAWCSQQQPLSCAQANSGDVFSNPLLRSSLCFCTSFDFFRLLETNFLFRRTKIFLLFPQKQIIFVSLGNKFVSVGNKTRFVSRETKNICFLRNKNGFVSWETKSNLFPRETNLFLWEPNLFPNKPNVKFVSCGTKFNSIETNIYKNKYFFLCLR